MTTTQSNLARKDDYRVSPDEQARHSQHSRRSCETENPHHHHYSENDYHYHHHHHHHHHSEEDSQRHHNHGEEDSHRSHGQRHLQIDLTEPKPSVEVLPAKDDGILNLKIDEVIDAAWSEEELADSPFSLQLIRPVAPVESAKSKKKRALRKHSLKYKHPVLHRILSVLLVIVLVLVGLAGAGVAWLMIQLEHGRGQMLVNYDGVVFSLPTEDERIVVVDNGQTITYNGHTYVLNENISTILFLGIDRDDMEEFEAVDVIGTGGQADVILLISQDTATGETKILNISRDTYAEFMTYSENGYQVGYKKGQICMAYAYGDGMETSCKNMVSSVSRLLYGMPISKYIAMDMAGVEAANDAVGGVTLDSMIDVCLPDGTEVSAGERITLRGEDCNRYLSAREHDIDGNNDRMLRNKQFVQAFVSQAKSQIKADLGVAATLYQEIMPYIVSDLDIGDVLFLAKTYLDYGVDFIFIGLDGTMDWLENQWGAKVSTLYPDYDQLFETVLDIYYTEVD